MDVLKHENAEIQQKNRSKTGDNINISNACILSEVSEEQKSNAICRLLCKMFRLCYTI